MHWLHDLSLTVGPNHVHWLHDLNLLSLIHLWPIQWGDQLDKRQACQHESHLMNGLDHGTSNLSNVTKAAHLMNGSAWFWGQELQLAPPDEWSESHTLVTLWHVPQLVLVSLFHVWIVKFLWLYPFLNLKQLIWDEIGQDQIEKEKVLLELEQECLDVYRRKVDGANIARARLHQSLADSEAEFTHLLVSLGERSFPSRVSWFDSSLTQWINYKLCWVDSGLNLPTRFGWLYVGTHLVNSWIGLTSLIWLSCSLKAFLYLSLEKEKFKKYYLLITDLPGQLTEFPGWFNLITGQVWSTHWVEKLLLICQLFLFINGNTKWKSQYEHCYMNCAF